MGCLRTSCKLLKCSAVTRVMQRFNCVSHVVIWNLMVILRLLSQHVHSRNTVSHVMTILSAVPLRRFYEFRWRLYGYTFVIHEQIGFKYGFFRNCIAEIVKSSRVINIFHFMQVSAVRFYNCFIMQS